MKKPRLTFPVAIGFVLIALAVYHGSRRSEFVWDDQIVLGQQLPYFESLSSVLFPPKNIPQFGYYRPLIILTYKLDEMAAVKLWPIEQRDRTRRLIFHMTPVLWHGAATILVFALGLALSRAVGGTGPVRTAGPAAAALLFAVHPIHTESVAWMAGRSDVVCAVFFLAALLFYLKHKETGRFVWLFGAGTAAFMSMLAKENGIAVVLMVLLIDLLPKRSEGEDGKSQPTKARAAKKGKSRRSKKAAAKSGPLRPPRMGVRWAVFGTVLAAYLAMRNVALSGTDSSFIVKPGFGLDSFASAFGWYVLKTVWPSPQSAFVGEIPGWPAALLGFFTAALSVALFLFWRRQRDWGSEAVSLALFFIALAPSLTIAVFSISETALAERYLYLPSAGVLLLFGFLAERAAVKLLPSASPKLRRAGVLAVALALALPASAATMDRVRIWKNDLALWRDTVRKSPRQGLPHLHLGIAYAKLERVDEALGEFKQALAFYQDPEGRARAHANLGAGYIWLGRLSEGIGHLQEALREQPDYDTAHYNWAVALLAQAFEEQRVGNLDEAGLHQSQAIDHLRQAIALNPRYIKALFKLGIELLNIGQVEEGKRYLNQVIQMGPDVPEAVEAKKALAGGFNR